MTTTNPANQERLCDLLADQAVQGLDDAERAELVRLLAANPDEDPWSLDWTAAAIDLPYIRPEPLPSSVRDRVRRDAVAWLARSQGLQLIGDATPAPPMAAPTASTPPIPWLPWLAAAACIALAAVAWWPRPGASPEQQYTELASRTAPIAWNDVEGAGVQGDIVWDNATQSGVMRFSGLAVHDPTKLQYQLWIFDAHRQRLQTATGEDFSAVDGGVFDVERVGDDVYVRVGAKLEVFDPKLFAVTTEPPGGVVKHIDTDDYRIILTAAPASVG